MLSTLNKTHINKSMTGVGSPVHSDSSGLGEFDSMATDLVFTSDDDCGNDLDALKKSLSQVIYCSAEEKAELCKPSATYQELVRVKSMRPRNISSAMVSTVAPPITPENRSPSNDYHFSRSASHSNLSENSSSGQESPSGVGKRRASPEVDDDVDHAFDLKRRKFCNEEFISSKTKQQRQEQPEAEPKTEQEENFLSKTLSINTKSKHEAALTAAYQAGLEAAAVVVSKEKKGEKGGKTSGEKIVLKFKHQGRTPEDMEAVSSGRPQDGPQEEGWALVADGWGGAQWISMAVPPPFPLQISPTTISHIMHPDPVYLANSTSIMHHMVQHHPTTALPGPSGMMPLPLSPPFMPNGAPAFVIPPFMPHGPPMFQPYPLNPVVTKTENKQNRPQVATSLLVNNVNIVTSPNALREWITEKILELRPISQRNLPHDRGAAHSVVRDSYIPLDHSTGLPKGFAFVEVYDLIDADLAVTKLPGKDLNGHPIQIKYAKAKRKTADQMAGKGKGKGW